MSKTRLFSGASFLAATLVLAGAAQAQTGSPTEVGEVVVTGSFIRGASESAALPVDVISVEDIDKQGSPSTLELIKNLSVSSGVLGDTNQFDTRAQGSEGSGSINLRGLGAQRTLVLMNGRRITANPFGQVGAGIVDTNILPSAAIGRIEILKDGAAATYGSDAIGGVVNFITRTNFDGLEVGGSYRHIDGSKGDYTATILAGRVGDWGNILLSAGYQHQAELSVTDRDWADKTYFENPEGGWSGGNAVTAFAPVFNPAPGVFAPAGGFTLDSGCAATGGTPTPIAGLPACFFHYTLYDSLVERQDRFQLYGEANVNLGDNHKLHVEALYSETDVPEWRTSPSYLALQTPTATTNPTIPSLTPALLSGFFVPANNPGLIAYRAANPTQIPAFATGVHIPGVRYRPLAAGGNPIFDNGPSEGLRQYRAYRVSAGLSGDVGFGDIGYDVAVTYSEERGYRTGYDTVVSRLQLALRGFGSAASDTAGGCTAAETANFTTNAGNTAVGCHFFNPFSNSIAVNTISGAANPGFNSAVANNPDVVRWFFPQVRTEQTQSLFVADAVLNGATGITLGGGDVAWAAGVQFRKDGFEATYNGLSDVDVTPCIDTPVTNTTGCTLREGPLLFLGTGGRQDLDGEVYAIFGELSVPFTEDIQLQLAMRYEDYGDVGTTTNPKASLRWQATDNLAFRGSAGSTFRGPPITSLTTNKVTGFSFLGGSFRAIDFFGNPALEPETANTYSVGAILDFGRFKATVDYFRFDFENPIVGEPAGSIVNKMFPTVGATGCGTPLQVRFTFQGACSIANIARVRTQVVNGPPIKTSGIDILADFDAGEVFFGGQMRFGLSATYTLEYKIDAFTVEGIEVERAYDAAGYLNYLLSATSLPELKGQVFAEYTRGAHNLRFTINYIDSYVDQRASIFAPNGVNGTVNPAGSKIDDTVLAEIDYRVLLPWETTLTVSVDNLFDQDPSFARLDLNYDPFTGNALGRTYKLGLKKKF